jgi:hypothetical protein
MYIGLNENIVSFPRIFDVWERDYWILSLIWRAVSHSFLFALLFLDLYLSQYNFDLFSVLYYGGLYCRIVPSLENCIPDSSHGTWIGGGYVLVCATSL